VYFIEPYVHPELLRRLREKVTLEATNSLSKATGIPPHVAQLNLMTSLLQLCQSTLVKVNEHAEVVRQTIFEAMELRAIENGQITRQQIVNILEDFRNGIRDDVRDQIAQIQAVAGVLQPAQRNPAGGGDANRTRQGTLFTYHGRFWDVPLSFAFPSSIKRDVGWRLWLQGMPDYRTVGENGVVLHSKIKPYRDFLPARLPQKIAEVYKLHWKPVFTMMEKGVGVLPTEFTIEVVDQLYDLGTEFLKTRVSYVFDNPRMHHNDWTMATWAKYVTRSMILKKGNENDKAHLPAATFLNRPRAVGLK
jgi:hypothetical protein